MRSLLELRRRLLSKRLQIVRIGLLVPAGLAGCGQIAAETFNSMKAAAEDPNHC